jgi:hypothetical protein
VEERIMIDINNEELLLLRDAAAILPRRRRGRKPNVSTLWRWVKRGHRGTRLEAVAVGGSLCTSREALQRFMLRLTAARGLGDPQVLAVQTPRQRRHDAEAADKELGELGV